MKKQEVAGQGSPQGIVAMTSVPRKSVAISRPPSILWFTILCSLLGALWSLNLFPQGPISFRVQTTVVLNSVRLEALQEILDDPSRSLKHPKCLSIRKVEAKELVSSQLAQPVTFRDPLELPDLHRVTIESTWAQRLAPSDVKAWLATLTEPSLKKLDNSQTARELRWVNYKLDLARRYSSADATRSDDFAASKIAAKTVGFSGQEIPTNHHSPTRLGGTSPERVIDLATLQQRETILRNQLQSERLHLIGTVSIAALSKWNPYATNDPLIAPILGLLLGAFMGMSLAYLLRRAPAQPYTKSSDYASTLQELQIPFFTLSSDGDKEGDEPSRLRPSAETHHGNHLQWWISGCEWSLLFWGISAALRFAIDANWRDLSISQPLLALARLFSSV